MKNIKSMCGDIVLCVKYSLNSHSNIHSIHDCSMHPFPAPCHFEGIQFVFNAMTEKS